MKIEDILADASPEVVLAVFSFSLILYFAAIRKVLNDKP
jgi:hypothetical protein